METDGDRLWLMLLLLGALVLLRGWYSACETALTELNDSLVHARAQNDPRWQSTDRLISAPTRMRRTFTMHRILSALLIGMLSYAVTKDVFAAAFPARSRALLTALVLTLGLTFGMAVFTDLFPKQLALRGGEGLARLCVPSVRGLMLLLAPLWAAASAVTALLCRICRIPAADHVDVVTEEEIRLLVDAGNETGGIGESQREMINNIFTFDDVAVSDVMTHRKDMTAVSVHTTAMETAKIAQEMGFSRIPVYENNIDAIVGVVLVKDLLSLVGRKEDCPVSGLMRAVLFVPETAKCWNVFQRMRRDKMQLAIVADEYGGTAGMVTMEDLLEEIVGSIQDEYDDEEAELTELSPGVFSIAGSADPEDILPRLGVTTAPELEDTFDTMSGFVVHLLGRIPEPGEMPAVTKDGVRYTLLTFEDNWISRIQAEILPQEDTTTE